MSNESTLTLNSERAIAWQDALPAGLTPDTIHFGRDESGIGQVQVAIAQASARPTKAVLEATWKTRGANTTAPVLVVVIHGENAWLYEHTLEAVGPISTQQASRRIQSILDEPDSLSAYHQLDTIMRSLATQGGGGYTNHFLFAGYHLRTNVPKRKDWPSACKHSVPLLSQRGQQLIQALGFETEAAPGASHALVLRAASGQRRALAVLLTASENFDQRSPAYPLSPVAHGLELASREGVPWVIFLRKGILRLYPGTDGVGVGQRGQSETYFELNLDLLDPDDAGYLDLIFSAAALEQGGSADEILHGSGVFAAQLGLRLRDRIYDRAVPTLAVNIAERLPAHGVALDAAGLQFAYALTLRVLFRILFQAYAEDSGLLPADRNEWFKANSLQAFVAREATTPREDFSATATSIWQDLRQVWDAVYNGNPRWEVPAYGGSLFDPTTREGAFLKTLELPDRVMGPTLQAILTDLTEEGVPGAVDFRSLQVREFGTIYEGLLESSLSLAAEDLTLDKSKAYVPAKDGDAVEVAAGQPYFHSASGERKATGSYFTPKIVVDHLIERSIQPALDAHLDRVKVLIVAGKDREAADLFWDFRVADLAMGSAHFLVAAIDKIERGMRDFLTANDVPGVMAELSRLAERAREQLGADTQAAEAITQAQLLRRQVARRCVYGLDINPFAVELARLAIWIHTFVPGLPMSSLDHGLVLGNSLTGVGSVEEALDALEPKRAPGQATFFDDIILDALAAAKSRLADYAAASEADKAEVVRGAELLAEAVAESAAARDVFDAAVAVRAGEIQQRPVITDGALRELVADPLVAEFAARVTPAHMPYLFPEVFLRDNPGFDALVGNPPWEKVKVEEHQWWGLRLPGLRSTPAAKRGPMLEEFKARRPDLVAQYEREVESAKAFRSVLVKGPYPGIGSGGDPDLYQAFAWRFWRLARDGGRSAIVVPRGAVSGSALGEWRKDVISNGSFADVCFLLNNQNWVFPSVHPQWTVALVVMERGGERVLRTAGPFASEAEFIAGASDLATFDLEEFVSWSGNAAIPLIPDAKSGEVFRQMKKSPRFDDARPDWEFKPTAELHSSADKSLYEFDVDQPRGRVSVLAGASFNLWDPNFGKPYAYGQRGTIRQALKDKLERASTNKRSAYFGMRLPSGELPMDRARIAFRDVTNQTNTRTTLACLVPPGSALTEMAPVLVRRQGDARCEAFLLGVMASIPFDWASRRWVELHVKYHLLNGLPIPSTLR